MTSRKRKGMSPSSSTSRLSFKLSHCDFNHSKTDQGEFSSCNHEEKSQFQHLFGFSIDDISNWANFVRTMYRPMDPASLGVVRALFGFLMILDIPEERGLSDIDIKWGDSSMCYFPLFNFISPLPLPWMGIVYLIMWCGALGIMVGFMFHLSCLSFVVPYWYIFLLDKSVWNNHSYLYGLIGILLLGSNANHYWSLDAYMGRVKANSHVPLWNYAILRFQFFVLYFIAGLKKLDRDWLEGYSMTHLNQHWIFEPFKFLLTPEQVDYWIIHLSGFLLDLTIGFGLFFDKTRPFAFLFCSAFHLMNSRLFAIGMFPYVCLVTLPIFCHANWPRKLLKRANIHCEKTEFSENENCVYAPKRKIVRNKPLKLNDPNVNISWKHHLVIALLVTHVGIQVFLPYSHFITKGYNNWTNGLYGYSWDMMVHSWDTVLVIVKVVDNVSKKEHFLDSEAWVQNDRWTKHADMLIQYGHCLRRNLLNERLKNSKMNEYITSENISIYIDVWSSLNGRFQQRMFDPKIDILTAEWSPFTRTTWLMPLLTEFSLWRQKMNELENDIYSWSNYSDVLFVADFPDLFLENYINPELTNVTLTVLEGEVMLLHATSNKSSRVNLTLSGGENAQVPVGKFHTVHTISLTPSCFMYTYSNLSRQMSGENESFIHREDTNLPDKFIHRIKIHVENFMRAVMLVSNSILNILYSVPMVKRVRLE